ncbi:MAG: gamma-glutamyl-gamma-aminobutyrate hydrolase family protein [Solobacterium sp.]|nr:gamma-glutamyl-gamma-aminobutyrate hydrolase family protein [Solobacterium sp.]
MKKPLLIAILPRYKEILQSDAGYVLKDYIDYLKRPGIPVFPILLPSDPADAEEAAGFCDGLLIPGGNDIDPALYHYQAEPDDQIECEPALIDACDISTYHAFQTLHKPIFGICRGIQLINTAEGGTLIPDIPSRTGKQHNQRKISETLPPDQTLHRIQFIEGTALYSVFGSNTRVNSFHHQAIDQPAHGFTVSGISDDGIIEAIEKDRILAVQWHPERMAQQKEMTDLAALFLQKCISAKQPPK